MMGIDGSKPNNTTVEKIDGVNYCVYCCQIAKVHTDYGHPHNNEPDVHYCWCDCPSALAELEMVQKIQEIKDAYIPLLRRNHKGLNDIHYNRELSRLKTKYNK